MDSCEHGNKSSDPHRMRGISQGGLLHGEPLDAKNSHKNSATALPDTSYSVQSTAKEINPATNAARSRVE